MSQEVQSDFKNNNVKNSEIDSELNSSLNSNDTTVAEQFNQSFESGGKRKSYHGDLYQMHFPALLALRLKQKGYEFELATEMNKAGKFDDSVVAIDGNNKFLYFVQIKSKLNEGEKIKLNNFLSRSDDDFALSKYFASYLKIKREFGNEIEREHYYCLFTNIDIDERLKDAFKKIDNPNLLIRTISQSKQTKYLKLDIEKFTEITCDLYSLAYELFNSEKLYRTNRIFRIYHVPLAEEVINTKLKKYKNDFIEGKNLSRAAKNLRKFLLRDFYKSIQDLEDKKFTISETFGTQQGNADEAAELPNNGVLEFNDSLIDILMEESELHCLANKLFKYIDEGDKLTLNEFFQKYHVALAKEVIDINKKKFKTSFINGKDLFEGAVKLRNILLTKFNNDSNEMASKTIQISKTFGNEGKLKNSNVATQPLPTDHIELNDIQDFFDQFIFAVNQPNEIELGEIVAKELASLDSINLRDSDLVGSFYQKFVLDYMKEKNARKLKRADFDKFYEDLEHKLASQQLIGCSKANLNRLKRSKKHYKVLDFYQMKLQTFIMKNNNLVKFNSSELVKHLNSELSLEHCDSYIFLRSDQLLDLKNMVKCAFKSKVCDLLIIEVGTTKELILIHKTMKNDLITSNLKRITYILPLENKLN